MKRTAVFVPTSGDPLEAIVHEPDGSPVACAVALPGAMSRAETNRKWARAADALADLGIVVLRYNYLDGSDETHMDDADRRQWAREGIEWFRNRMAGLDLLVCGHCYGSGVALSYAAANRTLGLALITPFLGSLGRHDRATMHAMQLLSRVASRAGVRLPSRTRSLDPEPSRDLVTIGSSPRPWVLVGERDYQWRSWTNPATAPPELASVDIEVVRGVQLHSARTPMGQDALIERLAGWAARTLAARAQS